MFLHQDFFFVKLSKFTTKPNEMLYESFGEYSLGWRADFERHSCFKASWVSAEDDKRSK
jgi:hypothetical protein